MPSLGELRIDLIADIAKFVSPFNKATTQLERFALSAEKALDRVEKSLEKAGTKLSLKITAPLLLLGREAIKAADASGLFTDSLERLGLQAKASLEPLGKALITVFEEFRPAIEDGIKFVYGLTTAFSELEPATKRQIILMAGVAAAIGPVLLAASGLVTVAKLLTKQTAALIGVAGDLVGKLAHLPATIGEIAEKTKIAAAGMKQLAISAAAVAIAFAAFELGKGLYDQFKIIQTSLAKLMEKNDIVWSHIRETALKVWTVIGAAFNDLVEWLQRRAGAFLEVWGTSMGLAGLAIGGTIGKTLEETASQIVALGQAWQEAKPPADYFDFEKLTPLKRLIAQAGEFAQKLGPEAAQKVQDAWSRISLIPKVEGLGASIKSLPGLSSGVDEIVAALGTSGDEAFKNLAAQLSARRDELFKSIGDLPPELQRELITRQESAARELARGTYKVTIDAINAEFGDKATGGEGFWGRLGDRMKADLLAIKDTLSDIPETIGNAVGGAANAGGGGGLMNFVNLLTKARSIAKDVKLPEVVTRRDLADLESYSKEMTDLYETAQKFRTGALREDAFTDQVGELEKLQRLFPEVIDDTVFARKMAKIKEEFQDLLPIGERVAFGLADAFKVATAQMSTFLADAVVDGKAKLGDLLKSITKTIIAIVAQRAIFGPLGNGIADYLTAGPAAGTPGGPAGPREPNKAFGGAFLHGENLAFASGGIVSRPTFFPMANGGAGLMGEAGPEAIMPLQRVNGYLGVRASGGGVTVNVIDQRRGGDPPQVTEKTGPDGRRQISVLIRDEMKTALGDGSLDKSLSSNFGLGRRGARR